MKKFMMGLALGTLVTAGSSFAADVRIGTEGAYAPWNFLDDDGKLAGYEIELGNEMCKRAGVECEWVVNEWDSICLLYTSPSPRDATLSRMPSSA